MNSNSSSIKEIIHLLKSMNYEFENWDEDWVENVLTTKCSSRNNLLLWALQQFGLLTTISFSSSEFSLKKIHKELLSIGICKSSDINIIEASACPIIQLKFWNCLLELILDLRCNIKNSNDKLNTRTSDHLLDNLIFSPYFQESMLKEGDFSLLPADLKKQYYNIKEKGNKDNLSCHFAQTEELLDELKNIKIDSEVIIDDCMAEELCHSISSLNKQVELMPEIFESSFAPWCNETSKSSSATSNILCNSVNKNENHLTTLMRTVKLEDEIDCSFNDIETKVLHLNCNNVKHGSIGVLNNISSTINKLKN